MKFEYLLFDWDGCLVDSLPIWFRGMREGVSYFGIDASDSDIKKGFQTWDVFLAMGVTDMDLFTKKVYEYVLSRLEGVVFNDGVPGLLEQIRKKNLKAAIVTSSEESKVLPVLKRLDATDYFECIICRQDVGKLKPDSEPVEKALYGIRGKKEQAVMVGDSTIDIEAGKNAGISTIWYSSKSNQDFHLNHDTPRVDPDMTISHMSELEDLISA